MPRGTEISEGDLDLLDPLIARMSGKKGIFERMGRTSRWLILEPVAAEPAGVSIEVQQRQRFFNVIVNNRAVEPGREARPTLGERGVRTPQGWQLMADAGWVLGWRAPPDTPVPEIVAFGFRVVRALSPTDGRWRARVEPRPPRPGFTELEE